MPTCEDVEMMVDAIINIINIIKSKWDRWGSGDESRVVPNPYESLIAKVDETLPDLFRGISLLNMQMKYK